MRKQNGWQPHLRPEDGGSYLHNATGHLYPRLSVEGPGELCHHFLLRYHDTWSQSMACAYLLLGRRKKKQEKGVYFLLNKTKPRQQPIILVFCEDALCVSTTVRQLKTRAQNHTLTSAQWHLPPLSARAESTPKLSSSLVLTEGFELWKPEDRCAVLQLQTAGTLQQQQRLMWRADCSLQRLISACTRNVSTSAVAERKGYSCSADLIVCRPDSEAAAGSRSPQGNKMSLADWCRQLRGPARESTFQNIALQRALMMQLWCKIPVH